MGLFTSDIKTMDDLFVHTLQDIYYAEKQILKSLPDMIDKATNHDLKAGLKAHLGETENHVGAARSGLQAAWARAERRRLSGDRRDHRGSR